MSKTFVYPDGHKQPVVFDSGVAVSDPFEVRGGRGADIQTDSGWTTADIGFDVSNGDGVWYPRVKSDGSRMKCTGVLATKAIHVPAEFWGAGVWPLVRLRSLNTSNEADVNQVAARNMEVKFYA